MKAIKVDSQGQLTHIIEYDTPTLPKNLSEQGYKTLIEQQQPPATTIEQDEQCLSYVQTFEYNQQDDTYTLNYELRANNSLSLFKMQQLTQQLASTDYIITKYQEAMLISALPASDTTPTLTTDNLNLDQYPLATILQNRATLRQQIRQLQNLLNENKQ